MLDKFADELKASREQRGLTLQQVAQKTKIDYKFLEVMEQGDFSFLPELYVKAFLKNYGRVIGIDEDVIVMKYEAAKSGRLIPEEEASAVETVKPPSAKKTESVKLPKAPPVPKQTTINSPGTPDKQKIIFIAAAVIVILVAAGYFIFSDSDSDIIVTEKPLDEIVNENRERYIEEEKQVPPAETVTVSSDSLQLNIASTETSWVKIVYDDRTTGEFILFPMAQKNVKASENFKITFGNAKGIKLKLNGSELTFNSKSNIARILIDSTGLQFLNPSKGTQN
jgi:cytoskeletal protein RodZ